MKKRGTMYDHRQRKRGGERKRDSPRRREEKGCSPGSNATSSFPKDRARFLDGTLEKGGKEKTTTEGGEKRVGRHEIFKFTYNAGKKKRGKTSSAVRYTTKRDVASAFSNIAGEERARDRHRPLHPYAMLDQERRTSLVRTRAS